MKNTCFLVFLFICCFSFGQQKQIDSLRVALKNAKQDTTYAKVLMELAEMLAQNTGFGKEWPIRTVELKNFTEKKSLKVKNLKSFIYYVTPIL